MRFCTPTLLLLSFFTFIVRGQDGKHNSYAFEDESGRTVELIIFDDSNHLNVVTFSTRKDYQKLEYLLEGDNLEFEIPLKRKNTKKYRCAFIQDSTLECRVNNTLPRLYKKVKYNPPPLPAHLESESKEDLIVFAVVKQMPVFPGGDEALKQFILDNTQKPDSFQEGTCYVEFIIERDGSCSNHKVLRGVPDCPECDTEVLRVIKEMPNWEPGKQNGRAVRVIQLIPVWFYEKLER